MHTKKISLSFELEPQTGNCQASNHTTIPAHRKTALCCAHATYHFSPNARHRWHGKFYPIGAMTARSWPSLQPELVDTFEKHEPNRDRKHASTGQASPRPPWPCKRLGPCTVWWGGRRRQEACSAQNSTAQSGHDRLWPSAASSWVGQ